MELTQLKKGQVGKILKVEESPFRDKLMEMGCVPGSLISLLMKAPLGDPLAFEIEGYTLSMRKSEAKSIVIELETHTEP